MNKLIHRILLSVLTGLSVLTSIAAYSAPIHVSSDTDIRNAKIDPNGGLEGDHCWITQDGERHCADYPSTGDTVPSENSTEDTAGSGNFSR